MPQYDHLQTIFAHALLSNLSALRAGTAVSNTADMVATLAELFARRDIRQLMGEWTVVWGPVVAQGPLSYQADNTLYVAKKQGAAEYVISVAGTNPFSWYDWFNQDLAVGKVFDWPFYGGEALNPALSQGTHTGLAALLAMAHKGQSLSVFWQQLMATHDSAVTMTVTGHSLGGALAPALALYLFDTQPAWNPEKRATISVVPFAGPTSGNKDFATYYNGRLGAQTTRVWNQLDVVPHAWDHQLLDQVADLYAPAIEADALVHKLIANAQKATGRHAYGHINPDTPGLPGTVHLGNPVEQALVKSLDFLQLDFLNFIGQIAYQHVEAYLQLLDVPEFEDILEIKLLNSLTFDLFHTSREKIEALWDEILSALGIVDD